MKSSYLDLLSVQPGDFTIQAVGKVLLRPVTYNYVLDTITASMAFNFAFEFMIFK